MQIAVSIFSIFVVSMIQQNTPDHLIGKVMSYAVAISMCAQPLGHAVYGILFDRLGHAVYLILAAAGVVVLAIALFCGGLPVEMNDGNLS